jgi:hypothetical protein
MRVVFDVPIDCPHCGHELDVPDRSDDVIEVTCIACKSPSTFENASYKRWLDQAVKTLQTGARNSRFAHGSYTSHLLYSRQNP